LIWGLAAGDAFALENGILEQLKMAVAGVVVAAAEEEEEVVAEEVVVAVAAEGVVGVVEEREQILLHHLKKPGTEKGECCYRFQVQQG
jgi:hypothetical protein